MGGYGSRVLGPEDDAVGFAAVDVKEGGHQGESIGPGAQGQHHGVGDAVAPSTHGGRSGDAPADAEAEEDPAGRRGTEKVSRGR